MFCISGTTGVGLVDGCMRRQGWVAPSHPWIITPLPQPHRRATLASGSDKEDRDPPGGANPWRTARGAGLWKRGSLVLPGLTERQFLTHPSRHHGHIWGKWLYIQSVLLTRGGYVFQSRCEHRFSVTGSHRSEGKFRVGFPQASGHHIFLNPSIHNLVLCGFPPKDALFHVYCWFINIEFMSNSTITHSWTKFIAAVFSRQSTSQPPCTHIRQDLNTALRATFNSKIIAKMHRNVKNMALNTAKRTPVYSKMLKCAASPCSRTCWEHAGHATQIFSTFRWGPGMGFQINVIK